MNIRFKRDLQHSWLMVRPEKQVPSSYAVRMLTENSIDGLLPCHVTVVDEKEIWYYDITGRQSLEDRLEAGPIGRDMLHCLLLALWQTAEQLDAYLLSPDGLVLMPEVCYFTPPMERFGFLFQPGEERDFAESLRALARSLLPHLDRADKEAVLLGYAFYQQSLSGATPAELLRQLLSISSKEERAPERPMPSRAEIEREELLDSFFEEEEEEGFFAKLISRFRRKKEPWQESVEPMEKKKHGIQFWKKKEEPDEEWLCEKGQRPEEILQIHESADKRAAVMHRVEEPRDNRTRLLSPDMHISAAPRLVAEGGADAGREIVLKNERCLVGKKEAGAGIHLSSGAVSRLHAVFSRTGDTHMIRDLNSRNGTFVNDRILSPEEKVLLRNDDRIRFADQAFIYRQSGS